MDNNIKKENPNTQDSDLSSLLEYNTKIPIKKNIVDDRIDNLILIGKENYYKETFNRRPAFPWEDSVLKERKYSDDEIKKIRTVYTNKRETEKITIPSAVLSKAAPINKGVSVLYQPTQDYTTSTVDYATSGKHDYTKTSWPNGWPLSPPENSSERVTIKIPGINSSFVVRDVIKPIFYNFIYDFHNTVESVNTLVPAKRGKDFEETKKLAASGKVKMISGDGGYFYRKIRGSTSHWSAHASATAIDINWNFHWLYWRNTFTASQVTTIRTLTKKYGLTWGGEYEKRADEMHFEIKVSPSVVEQIISSNGLVDRMSKIASGMKVTI